MVVVVGLEVDGEFESPSLPDGEGEDDLGVVLPHNAGLRPRISFASFVDAHAENYSDLSRIFDSKNDLPLSLPAVQSYPRNFAAPAPGGVAVCTMTVHTDEEVDAVRIFPAHDVSVFSVDPREKLGVLTEDDDGGSSASLRFAPTRALRFESVGALDLVRMQLYSAAAARQRAKAAVFPLNPAQKALPYLRARVGELTVRRLGGLYTGPARVVTAGLGPVVVGGGGRAAIAEILLMSVEEMYVRELQVYRSLRARCDEAFPVISAADRAAMRQEEHVRSAIADFLVEQQRPLPSGELRCRVDASVQDGVLYLAGVASPAELDLVLGVVYEFDAVVPLQVDYGDGQGYVSTHEVMLGDESSTTARFAVGGKFMGTFRSVRGSFNEEFSVPPLLFESLSLSDALVEVEQLVADMPAIQADGSPNEGTPVAHVAFLRADGAGEMTCEEAIFMPGDTVDVCAYSSEEDVVVAYIDGAEAGSISVTREHKFAVSQVTLPVAPGVHALSTDNGSNVLFRISEKSVLHAPVHPQYYTSGQLEEDSLTSSPVELVLQHNNFDLIGGGEGWVIEASSGASLVDIPDVVFAPGDMACRAAYLCRFERPVVSGGQTSAVHFAGGAKTVYCEDTPWLSCVDVSAGCVVVGGGYDRLDHFSLYWHPDWHPDSSAVASCNVTLLQGSSGALFVRGGLLHLSREGGACRVSDASDALRERKWTHICFTDEFFFIDGRRQPTSHVQFPRLAPADKFVIGTAPALDLLPLIGGGPGGAGVPEPVLVPDYCRDRLTEECVVTLEHHVELNSFMMFTSGDVMVWVRRAEPGAEPGAGPGAEPVVQTFVLASGGTLGAGGSLVATTLPHDVRRFFLAFESAGAVRNVCLYSEKIPLAVVSEAHRNRDSVIDFGRRQVVAVCTNVESVAVKSESYAHHARVVSDAGARWMEPQSHSSFFVTPPSLVLLKTSQDAPYSVGQSLLLIFNRRIEVFIKSEETLFTLTSVHGTAEIPASRCSLLSSQIHVSSQHLDLRAGTEYAIHLAAGRLFQFNGRVPCLEGTVFFSTL